MTPGRVLAELEALAARLCVSVRAEPFAKGLLGGRGGLCWVDGKALVVMDEKLSVEERIGVLAEALSRFDLDAAAIRPFVRERIEAARTGTSRRPPRAKKGKPGLARAKVRRR